MFIVQTASSPIAQHLMELLIMVNAAKLASAKRITAVIPWYFYARQDKKSRPREPITARLVADLLETAGVDRVITMDLHAGQVQGFFRIPVDHMVAVPMFAQHVRDLLGPDVERVAVAPDTGRAKLAGHFAEMIGGGLVVLNKERPGHNQAKVRGIIGEVDGKVAVMTDDIIDTAGTLCAGAEALREAGATRVIACATHALFNEPALQRIADSAFERVIVTDTVPVDELGKPANVEVLSISGLLAETIQNVFSDDSVSAIFAGENQLFCRTVLIDCRWGRAGTPRTMRISPKLLGLIYVAIGVFVAANKDYFENLETLKRVASAVLAILLWPLLLARRRPAYQVAGSSFATIRRRGRRQNSSRGKGSSSSSARPSRGACASRA